MEITQNLIYIITLFFASLIVILLLWITLLSLGVRSESVIHKKLLKVGIIYFLILVILRFILTFLDYNSIYYIIISTGRYLIIIVTIIHLTNIND